MDNCRTEDKGRVRGINRQKLGQILYLSKIYNERADPHYDQIG